MRSGQRPHILRCFQKLWAKAVSCILYEYVQGSRAGINSPHSHHLTVLDAYLCADYALLELPRFYVAGIKSR